MPFSRGPIERRRPAATRGAGHPRPGKAVSPRAKAARGRKRNNPAPEKKMARAPRECGYARPRSRAKARAKSANFRPRLPPGRSRVEIISIVAA